MLFHHMSPAMSACLRFGVRSDVDFDATPATSASLSSREACPIDKDELRDNLAR